MSGKMPSCQNKPKQNEQLGNVNTERQLQYKGASKSNSNFRCTGMSLERLSGGAACPQFHVAMKTLTVSSSRSSSGRSSSSSSSTHLPSSRSIPSGTEPLDTMLGLRPDDTMLGRRPMLR